MHNLKPSKYTDLQPFQAWVQQSLPAVYDDSLSYTDLLDKMLYYLNNLVTNNNTLSTDVTNAINYINNYFNNLDVQDEINNKLDEMAENGSLSRLIQPLFDAYKKDIDQTVATQNASISSIQSQQNVLKQRMDTFTQLPSGSTSGDAELQDIRVGANGITYNTAGDAVRGQYSQLKEDIANKLPKSPTDWEQWTVDEQAMVREKIGISGYELLCDVTLEEAIDDFVRDTYSDGTPYNLSKALVFINVPVQKSGYVPGTCWIYFKDSNKFNSGRLYYSSKSSVNRQFILKAEQITSNGVWSFPTGEFGQEYLASTGMTVYNTKMTISNICTVQITCSFPKGTNIKIYGVRA